jgi:hypothetical protein
MDPKPTDRPDPQDTWARPVDRLATSQYSAEAVNMNVAGRHLTSPLNGFGQLWQKTYQVRLAGLEVTPQEVVRLWKEKLPELMPADSRFYPSITGVKPGEVLLINATVPGIPGGMPVSTGVLILYADDVSFSVMTPEGHPEAGFNTFSAHEEDGVTIAQVQSLCRANDPVFEFGFRFMGGARQQEKVWRTVLTNLARQFDLPSPEVNVVKVCVDTRLQWSQAKNVWHNSVIRTTMAAPFRAIGKLFKR